MEGSVLGIRKGAWTEEEDILLRKCIETYGEGKWHLIPSRAGLNRCRKSCRLRWLNYLKPNIKRGHFADDEVDLIIRLQKLLGNRWSLIAGRIPGRTANDVKNYWNTHLLKKLNTYSNKESKPKPDQIPSKPKTDVIKPRPRTLSVKSFPVQLDGNNHAAVTPASNNNLGLANSYNNGSYCIPNENNEIMWWENLLLNLNEVDNQQQDSFNNSNLSGLGYQAINEDSGDRRSMVVDEGNYCSWAEFFCDVEVGNVSDPKPKNYL
ncbi:hypothetical protein DITRI_Ditri11bG0020800 [Diplodiscus trichospermus]